MAFFMVMPTTISTGYIVTGEANGNQPLALMLSAGTNLMGAVSVPLWASAALGAGNNTTRSVHCHAYCGIEHEFELLHATHFINITQVASPWIPFRCSSSSS